MKRTVDYSSILGDGNPLKRFPRLYDAALSQFALKRCADASLNEMIDEAGISKGSLYHHFGDKFGLYLAVLDKAMQKRKQFIKESKSYSDAVRSMRLFMQSDFPEYCVCRIAYEDPYEGARALAFFPDAPFFDGTGVKMRIKRLLANNLDKLAENDIDMSQLLTIINGIE